MIEKIRVAGKMRNSPEVNARIQDKWAELPRRIQAVFLNKHIVINDKYGAIWEYVCKNPAFFVRFRRVTSQRAGNTGGDEESSENSDFFDVRLFYILNY